MTFFTAVNSLEWSLPGVWMRSSFVDMVMLLFINRSFVCTGCHTGRIETETLSVVEEDLRMMVAQSARGRNPPALNSARFQVPRIFRVPLQNSRKSWQCPHDGLKAVAAWLTHRRSWHCCPSLSATRLPGLPLSLD